MVNEAFHAPAVPASGPHGRIEPAPSLFSWLLPALILAAALVALRPEVLTALSLTDSDDAMRLVTVRALLAGQDLFDLTVARLDPAGGVVLHWSRLVDAPIAGLIALFGTVVPTDTAELYALTLWPLLLLLPAFYAAGLILTRLGAPRLLPGFLLFALSLGINVQFAPQRIDHHNVQLVLTLAMAALLIAPRRAGHPLIAGLLAALSLAIGLETLPYVIAFGVLAAHGALFGADGESDGDTHFALALAVGAGAFSALFVPPPAISGWACDTLSPVYVFGAFGAAALFVINGLMLRFGLGRILRLGVFGAGGAGLVAALGAAFPACLGGPMGELDPFLTERFLSQVSEAQSLLAIAAERPERLFMIVLPVAGIVLALLESRRCAPQERAAYRFLAVFILFGTLTGLMQVRALIAPGTLAALVVGAIVARRFAAASGARARIGAAALLVAGAMPLHAILFALAFAPTAQAGADAAAAACYAPDRLSAIEMALGGSEQGAGGPVLVLSERNLGAHLLAFTGFSVLDAPYHRSVRGMIAAEAILTTPPEEGAARARAEGIGLLIACPALGASARMRAAYPQSLYAALAGGIAPPGYALLEGGPEGFVIARALP